MTSLKTMRITGGQLVRKTFFIPKLVDDGVVRPTPDRVRESLFAMLLPYLKDAQVLDLFSGSGSHGFESISRGAQKVFFVEKDPSIKKTIDENIKKLAIADRCEVILSDVYTFIKYPKENFYDLIFLDPPYSIALDGGFFAQIKPMLKEEGLIIYRAFKKSPLPFGDDWSILREKVYGGTKVFVLKKSS